LNKYKKIKNDIREILEINFSRYSRKQLLLVQNPYSK